ncbi:hypothetical protein C3L57_08680, partial [Veillonellaceae bacterium M2-8]|nr:hypothetical protein [Veillonellaceae bacterium M2-8]
GDADFEEGFPGLGVADCGFADGSFDGGLTGHGACSFFLCVADDEFARNVDVVAFGLPVFEVVVPGFVDNDR